MKTFALRDGDLVLAGDRYAMVEGMARVQQQIGLCLREPYGGDRFHDRWGSVLPNWIGRVIESGLDLEVRSEVLRVIKNFIRSQEDAVRFRAVRGLRPVITAEEMVTDVTDIRIEQREDTLLVKVTLKTGSSKTFSIVTSPGRES